jgi:hypothetical protein
LVNKHPHGRRARDGAAQRGRPARRPWYCDLYALRDREGRYRKTFDVFPVPGAGCAFADAVGCVTGRAGTARHSTFSRCRALGLCRRRRLHAPGGQTVFPVQSAFGGLAVYHAAMLRGGLGSSVNGSSCRRSASACEHVGLHACLPQAGARQLVATGLAINWEGCGGRG